MFCTVGGSTTGTVTGWLEDTFASAGVWELVGDLHAAKMHPPTPRIRNQRITRSLT